MLRKNVPFQSANNPQIKTAIFYAVAETAGPRRRGFRPIGARHDGRAGLVLGPVGDNTNAPQCIRHGFVEGESFGGRLIN